MRPVAWLESATAAHTLNRPATIVVPRVFFLATLELDEALDFALGRRAERAELVDDRFAPAAFIEELNAKIEEVEGWRHRR